MKEALFLRGPACEGLATQLCKEKFGQNSRVIKVADRVDMVCKTVLYPGEYRTNSIPATTNGYEYPHNAIVWCSFISLFGSLSAAGTIHGINSLIGTSLSPLYALTLPALNLLKAGIDRYASRLSSGGVFFEEQNTL